MWTWMLTLSLVATPQGSLVDTRSFVNWESPHVHPLELTPNGKRLLATNTADAVLEVFEVRPAGPDSGGLEHAFSVPVGLDPVSVRARSDREAWVVNHVSDSVSVVDLRAARVVRTLQVADEPADVVFNERKAFVTCSQSNLLLVFDLNDLDAKPVRIPIRGEDPRALAISDDGRQLYIGIFESGNRSTILAGGQRHPSMPDAVGDLSGPYQGLNPPPNRGTDFEPSIRADLPPPPEVALIVKQDEAGVWKDDNGADWTAYVQGDKAHLSGRPTGWKLLDHDIAVVDALTLDVRYVSGLMNICAALSVHPIDGTLAVVGTDAINEVRYVQNLAGRFVRSRVAFVDLEGRSRIRDLNPHLSTDAFNVPAAERSRSIGEPRGVAWAADGRSAYITGLGSNNLIRVDGSGTRNGREHTIETGEGPTGVVFDSRRNRIYVLNRFGASISIVDAVREIEVGRTPFHDATPSELAAGRRLLHDSHATSGTGAVSCSSCHVDARMDRLAWDLGNPRGPMLAPVEMNLGADIVGSGVGDLRQGFRSWHPMKGPMVTQTLQDIIGKEPFHWRGDRAGIEEFAATFVVLQGSDHAPSPSDMQLFENYLATIAFPPNPFRNLDNTPATQVLLPTPVDNDAGPPLTVGNAARGRAMYKSQFMPLNAYCATCHSLPTGTGANQRQDMFDLDRYHNLPPGPEGAQRTALFAIGGGGSDNVTMKSVQLRNLHEKTGFDLEATESLVGFGFRHDSSVDTLPRLLTQRFDHAMSNSSVGDTQPEDIADTIAFLLSLSGETRRLPRPLLGRPKGGPPALATHAGIGHQLTLASSPDAASLERLNLMLSLAEQEATGLIAKGGAERRGYYYTHDAQFQSDREDEVVTLEALLNSVARGAELTFTLVPFASRVRLGVDRDEDGIYDADELLAAERKERRR